LPSRKASSSRLSASRTPSGTRPARQRGPVWRIVRLGARRLLHLLCVRACRRGATSTAAIAAPVPMPPVATSEMATRARTNCSSDNSPRSETLYKAACYGLVHENRRQGHGQVRLVGQVMGSRRGGTVGMGIGHCLCRRGCPAGCGGPPWCWVRQPLTLWWTRKGGWKVRLRPRPG
jgi:hypothetical protein